MMTNHNDEVCTEDADKNHDDGNDNNDENDDKPQ